jgi:Domain of unknown function (DUF4282)
MCRSLRKGGSILESVTQPGAHDGSHGIATVLVPVQAPRLRWQKECQMDEQKGIVGCLLDFSFSDFVTTRIIKLLYILSIFGAGFFSLAIVVGGFASKSGAGGILALLLAPLVFGFLVLSARIYMELIIVVFKIAENTGRIADEKDVQEE